MWESPVTDTEVNTSSTGSPTSPEAAELSADTVSAEEDDALSEDSDDAEEAEDVSDAEASAVDDDEAAEDADEVEEAADDALLLPHPAIAATMAVLIRIAKSLRFISFPP